MPESRTPALLVIGATGAGKTSLVSRLLLRRPESERWAVLVNDFGTTTLAGAGACGVAEPSVAVREVGGCICCTAHVALRIALVTLIRETRPQRIIIEAAGAASPRALLHVLSEPGLAAALELRKTLCVVAPNQIADPRYTSSDVYREQITAADGIIAAGDVDAVRAEIAHIRPAPVVYYDARSIDLESA